MIQPYVENSKKCTLDVDKLLMLYTVYFINVFVIT